MQGFHGNSIDLPRQECDPTKSEYAERPGVLIVDGDHWVRVMLQLGLQRNGFDVWSASNDLEVLDLYLECGFLVDVVLLDITQPNLNGPRILDGLQGLNPDVLVCFMVGEHGVSKPEAWLGRGTGCFITKPFYVDRLAEVLRPFSGNSRRLCGTVNKRFIQSKDAVS
jgi:DNA-binding NtrC family response regulator